MSKSLNTPCRATMCATCPFRPGSKYELLRPDLTADALTNASRVCHMTGSNAINRHTGKPDHLCRGARDIQLRVMAGFGVIESATDEAWNKERANRGWPAITIKDP